MPNRFLVENASGWVAPLPQFAREELARHWPDVSIEWIETELGYYLLVRDAADRQPEPADIKKRYLRIKQRAKELRADVRWLRGNNLGDMLQQSAPLEYFDNLKNLERELVVLDAVLPKADKHLPEGHQGNPRHRLVEVLIEMLDSRGLAVDKRPNGALCSILGILLQAAGEPSENVVEIVKPVLAAWLKKKAKE
ncbi:hypothetical protein ACFSOZ_16305 [Mesorhizobium newzealandense]|uniref:Uncharacterized protein n=1 Tax=Mesorhizobium newzealandense TaxID=1300302 RepID=A0ABW4UDG1_9HYPH